MKSHTFILALIIFMLISACSNIGTSATSTMSDQLVLEVITTASGMAYPKEGDILHMRLFKSGRFEYDDFPDVNPPKVSSRNVIIRRKEAKLSLEDVKELMDLMSKPDFLSAKDEYSEPYPGQSRDTEWVTKIKFRHENEEKNIVAVNFWGTQYNPEIKSKYPPSMVKLLERVEELKAKAIGRASTQWLASPAPK